MFLVNSIGDKIYNLDHAAKLYIKPRMDGQHVVTPDGELEADAVSVYHDICVELVDGTVEQVVTLDRGKEVRAEFDRIIEALERGDKVYRIGD